MSNPISVQSSQPSSAPVAVHGRAVNTPSPPRPASGPGDKPAQLYANPDFRFDPALGLVVIQFRDASGNLTNSIPSQRQLDAYRVHGPPSPHTEGQSHGAPAVGGPDQGS